ncbi:uncharacterized protein F4812DRAFT_421167 [Daldinia caldariorum]|uniref:uncharacterized protein n=1 Tax=Daldinia caldariorum TaxID=326644 RepID=UPI0020086CF5|nr:uncharacterized protein F4812DRAFT_421167 [Daldinia caldariorum]KAI1470001.1 hypothetical protein F4812DRAFT_421167 [Daldinia caldariorum]
MAELPDASQPPRTTTTTTTPKLRSSCDSCGSAKVRCDRSRPKCRRCVTLGIDCVYGISRKLGRVPRRGLSTNIKFRASIGTSGQTQTLQSDDNLGGSESTVFEEPRRVHSEAEESFSGPGCETSLPGSNIDAPSSNTYGHNQFGLDIFNPLAMDQWPQFDVLDFGIRTASSPKDSTAEAGIRKASDTRASHSCARESYEIFADSICPAPDLHAPDTNSDTVTARLDQVLHFNRKAIDRLSGLLKCSCAKSGHRIMVHASIISRILIWYQQAAGWPCSTSLETSPADVLDNNGGAISSSASSPSEPNEATGTGSSKLRILPRTTGFVVTGVPATLGTFSIEDGKMQAVIRNHLVLSELSRMSTLIDLFSSHFSGELSVAGTSGLYTYIAAWLRNEYDNTIRDLKADRISLRDALYKVSS